MRACWNWQTGTFEGRVFMTYGFKSRRSHQVNRGRNLELKSETIQIPAFFSMPKLQRLSHFSRIISFYRNETLESKKQKNRL